MLKFRFILEKRLIHLVTPKKISQHFKLFRQPFTSITRALARDSAALLSCSISSNKSTCSVSKIIIFSIRTISVRINPCCISLILMMRSSTFVLAVFDIALTLNLNLALRFGHSRVPTRNSVSNLRLCFLQMLQSAFNCSNYFCSTVRAVNQ
jgi:hypothetical protein